MGLRDVESTLPPGFRFYPSDEELVCHYLYKKVANQRVSKETLVEVNLHTREPWELPEVAKLSTNEWYFFSFRDRKYATGSRANRATKCGYWKATGKDKRVYNPSTNATVGMRKTLVFYRGRAPNGVKTSWVMHEFRLENLNNHPKEDWVLCRVFNKIKGVSVSASLENMKDNTGSLSPNYVSSPPTPVGKQMQSTITAPHQEDHSSNPSLLDMTLFLNFPQELDSTAMIGMGSSSRSGDDYGFLMDVGSERDPNPR